MITKLKPNTPYICKTFEELVKEFPFMLLEGFKANPCLDFKLDCIYKSGIEILRKYTVTSDMIVRTDRAHEYGITFNVIQFDTVSSANECREWSIPMAFLREATTEDLVAIALKDF
jgi:hypothetical protein